MGVWKDKEKGYWVAKFRFQNRQYKKTGFKTRTKALQWEVKKRAELNAPMIETPSIYFQELATDYLNDCTLRMVKNTVRQKAFVFRSFLSFLGSDRPVEVITKQQINEYLTKRALQDGNKASNRDLKDLKALFNWGINQDKIDMKNPCKNIPALPEEPPERYTPSIGDVIKILLIAEGDLQDFISTVFHTLGRRSEVNNLTWDDVNFEAKRIRLYTRKRRGGQLEENWLPVNEKLYDILYARFQKRDRQSQNVFGFDFYKEPYKSMMERLCQKADVKPFGFTGIRRSVASYLNDPAKASMKQIQILMRHKRQTTTEIYLDNIAKDIRDVAEILADEIKSGTKRYTKTGKKVAILRPENSAKLLKNGGE